MFFLSAAALCALHRERWRKWSPVALTLLAGLVFTALASPRMSKYVVRTSAQFFVEAGVERRMKIWKDTLRMFRARPLTGTGLGTYDEIAFSRYGAPYGHFSDDRFRRGGWHAHNVHLHILAETGILGFSAWVYFLFCLAAMGVRSRKQSRSPESRALSEAFLLSGACFLVLSMTENLIAPRVHQSFRMNLTLALLILLSLSSIRWADRAAGRAGVLVE
ncbi:MAG: hypothetical protein A3A86_05835 [Elusimicrobia bacterium RIFCSPLOWO2_01_FULL_60_11]|nr:MAG: hypothetical protein A3A86_05835 [Elusimicrobia bacterium RIFCSPLOWO2_01_FULL_60_11]